MKSFAVGFARVDITPPLGMPLAGYANVRLADSVSDALEVNALALSLDGESAVVIAVDNVGLLQRVLAPLRASVAQAAGLPMERVIIACTHTHTAGDLNDISSPELQGAYHDFLKSRLCDAAVLAMADLKPARMGWAVGHAPDIAFIRRYRMKDGSIRTNPGANNPDILCPLGEVDDSVSVLRFAREGADDIVLMHFGCHPDTVGGCTISADWPGFARRTLERALPGVHCLLLNGAEGDVNHVNVHPDDAWVNDLADDFDDVMRGYGHARHMGMVVAGAAMQVYSKVHWTDVKCLRAMERVVSHASNMPKPEELPQAREIWAKHLAGREDELPYKGMMLTTVVYEAGRMLELEHGPERFDLTVTALSLGDVAFACIPGEPFADIGRVLRKAPGYRLVLPCACANGYEGYFPTMEAYAEGGYEARSSIFRPGVGEAVAQADLDMLSRMREN